MKKKVRNKDEEESNTGKNSKQIELIQFVMSCDLFFIKENNNTLEDREILAIYTSKQIDGQFYQSKSTDRP